MRNIRYDRTGGGNKITKLDRKINKTSIGNSNYYFYNHYNLKKIKKL